MSLRELRDAIRSGERSAAEVCRDALARIEALNRSLNAFNWFAEDEHLSSNPTTSWPRIHADERGSNNRSISNLDQRLSALIRGGEVTLQLLLS